MVKFPDGRQVTPSAATVYVFFSGTPDPRVDPVNHPYRDSLLGSDFYNDSILYTAAAEFKHRMDELVSEDKFLKRNVAPASEERDLEIADRRLRYTDDAIAKTLTWVGKHRRNAWQVRRITPDDQGLWSTDNLKPGNYDVVVRGVVTGLDAAWFFSTLDVCTETVSLESQPAFFRPVKH